MAKKVWRKDGAFCGWIIQKEYAYWEDGKLKPYMAEGQIIYMWEAWRGGIDDERREERARRKREDIIIHPDG
jgi:hypothetical protein